VQTVKQQISNGDPTLVPMRELRRIFFDTLVSPLQNFEFEYNEILSSFVLLRNKFKEYLDSFLEFDDWCSRFINLSKIPEPENDPHGECFKLISVLMRHIDRMENILHEILTREELENRLHIIQKILAQEQLKMQDIEAKRRIDYETGWISSVFGNLDLRGIEEAKTQLRKLETYLLDFGSAFRSFKTHLKLVRIYLGEAQKTLEIEVRINEEGGSSKEEIVHTLDFLWKTNERGYMTLRTLVEPDTSEIIVQLPLPKEKVLL